MTFLKRLFTPAAKLLEVVEHPALGTLRYDAESETWGKLRTVAGHEVRLSVTGQLLPDHDLLNHLTHLESSLPELVPRIQAFLESEAAHMPGLAAEVRSLVVDEIGMWWPEQADVAMVWFKGPADRLWHCDYRNGALSRLAYDA